MLGFLNNVLDQWVTGTLLTDGRQSNAHKVDVVSHLLVKAESVVDKPGVSRHKVRIADVGEVVGHLLLRLPHLGSPLLLIR